jgi:hypothetical protein
VTRRHLAIALAATLSTALLPAAALAQTTTEPSDSRVVVAPMDSGINPYHEAFQVEASSVTQEVLDEFGIPPEHVLALGESYEADRARIWDRLQTETDYHFLGTNIIARSFSPGSRVILPDSEGDTHGVGVAGSVARGNPEAIIYFIEGGYMDAGEPYTFAHPSVDIVTMSYGLPVAAMANARVGAYEGVVELGKLSFGAATNDPQAAPLDGTAGPWYEIAIAGYAEGDGEARTTTSGNLVDFVADFTQDVPYCAVCTSGTETVSGTSFATPYSAGVTSAILLEARRRAGHVGGITEGGLMVDAGGVQLSNWDLRRALEEGSIIPTSTTIGTNLPVNPVAPYVQVGWGAITGDPELQVAERTLGQLFDADAAPLKSADTCAYMTQYMTARTALWDANPDPVFGGSGSFGQTNALGGSPYIAC